MNHKKLIWVAALALAAVLILSTQKTLGAPMSGTIGGQTESAGQADDPANPGTTDIAVQGTMWRAQEGKSFSQFMPLGWGTVARRKLNKPADQWVHIGLPLLTYLEDRPQKVRYVEFCARSTNGAVTKPTRMDLWDNDHSIGAYGISWPADNAYHCFGHDFGTGAVWRATLGVSVQLHFANSTDSITLFKAWAHITD